MRNIQIMQVFQSIYDVIQLRIVCEGKEVRINLLLPHRQESYEPTMAGGLRLRGHILNYVTMLPQS